MEGIPTKDIQKTTDNFVTTRFQTPISWKAAAVYCQNKFSTSLASIRSSEENEEIAATIDEYDNSSEAGAWIGLISVTIEERIWIDSSTQFYESACPYSNWNYDLDYADEGCGQIRGGLWIIVDVNTCVYTPENTYWAVCNSFVLFVYPLLDCNCVHVFLVM